MASRTRDFPAHSILPQPTIITLSPLRVYPVEPKRGGFFHDEIQASLFTRELCGLRSHTGRMQIRTVSVGVESRVMLCNCMLHAKHHANTLDAPNCLHYCATGGASFLAYSTQSSQLLKLQYMYE
jgi:hypothetical protein